MYLLHFFQTLFTHLEQQQQDQQDQQEEHQERQEQNQVQYCHKLL